MRLCLMQVQRIQSTTTFWPYLGLVLLAIAVVVQLLTGDPSASDSQKAALEAVVAVLVIFGLCVLLLGSITKLLNRR